MDGAVGRRCLLLSQVETKGTGTRWRDRCERGCDVWQRFCVIGRVVLFQGEGRKLLMGRCARYAAEDGEDVLEGAGLSLFAAVGAGDFGVDGLCDRVVHGIAGALAGSASIAGTVLTATRVFCA
jgi:hypothetical protein